MTIRHINASTQTVATPLLTIQQGILQNTPITLYNGHSASIFVGDSTVAVSGATIGRTIGTGLSQTFYVNSGDVIYGISAVASAAGAIVITYSA
jgi:hypothetical protein